MRARTTRAGKLIILIVMGAHFMRGREVGHAQVTAVALIVGGGLGNVIDRIAFGFVRDFANLGIGPVRTGIFNVADVAISVGVLLLVATSLSRRGPVQRPGGESSACTR